MTRRPAIRPKDQARAAQLRAALTQHENAHGAILGLGRDAARDTLIAQIIDSERRVAFVMSLRSRTMSSSSTTSRGRAFDPIRGALYMKSIGDHDEACWLVFLSAHFARNSKTEWQLAGDFYNRLGDTGQWTWLEVCSDPPAVKTWLDENRERLRATGGNFGNHRKYESLTSQSTGEAMATYIDWVGDNHKQYFDRIVPPGASPQERFGALYKSMRNVYRFGRVGRFDYLTMLSKTGLVDISPDSCHLDSGATGPKAGAKLLLLNDPAAKSPTKTLEASLLKLAKDLSVTPDVLEDALCNWQKNPFTYRFFAG